MVPFLCVKPLSAWDSFVYCIVLYERGVIGDGVSLFSCQNGQTPLMVASEQGNLEIVKELIRRGANANCDDVVSIHTHTHT